MGALVWAGVTAVRATLVLAGAFALAGVLRRASASVHHALWTVTLVSLLALPALPLVLPQFPVPVPLAEGWLPEPAVAPMAGVTGMAGMEAGGGGGALPDGTGAGEASATSTFAGPEGGLSEGMTSRGASRAAQDEAQDEAQGGAAREAPAPEPHWLLLVWVMGAAALALSLVLGLWRSSRVWRAARPARDEAWLHHLERARVAVEMERPVSLRFSGGVRTGMAGGLVRSFVLLPHTARGWKPGRREMVLLHELVHLRRRDPLRKVLGRVALALYWFHPLAWWAARAAARAREEACDDAVVALGHRPSAYARHLLDLADPARLPLPALARIDRPPLEKRIMRLLRSPSVSSPRTVTLAAVLALSWVVLVAALAPVARAAAPTAPAAQDTVRVPPPPPQVVPMAPPPVGPVPALPAMHPTPILPPDTTDACHPDPDGAGFVHGEGLSMQGSGAASLGSDDWLIQREVGGAMLCIRAHATGDPAALGPGPIDLPPGSWMVLASRGEATSQRLEMLPGPSGPEHTWYVNGETRPFDEAARAWHDAMLDVVRSAAALSTRQRQDARLQGEIARDVSQLEARLRHEISVVQMQQERVARELARTRDSAEASREEVVAQVLAARERAATRALPEIRRLEASLSAMRGAMEVLEREQARERLRMAMGEVERALVTMRERADSGRASVAVQHDQIQLEAAGRIAALRYALEKLDTAEVDETRTREETRRTQELERRLRQAEARLLEIIRRIR